MKIVLLNTYATGGAARACYRLRQGLVAAGANVTLFEREQSQDTPAAFQVGSVYTGRLRALFDYVPLKAYPRRQPHNFSQAMISSGLAQMVRPSSPDIVHLHWVPQGFVKIEEIADFSGPIVWTLHDPWPFTGGCHLPGDCRKYENQCGACPVLGSKKEGDLSRRVWQRKSRSYPVDRLTVVAPSHWMAAKVKSSSLMKDCSIEIIPNGVDTRIYTPGSQTSARDELGLPHNKRLILCGARHIFTDRNKGFDLLCAALGKFTYERLAKTALVVFGDSPQSPLPSLGIEIVNRGEIVDEKVVAALYRAADLLVVPSREENLPNMISEAMACGLPCAAFDVGGIGDQVRHRVTGCLVPAHDADALATEITWLLENAESRTVFSQKAREHAIAKFSLESVCSQHLSLYNRLLNLKDQGQHA